MIDHRAYLRDLATSDLDDLIPRLLLLAHKECGADQSIVARAVEEALDGKHEDLWEPGLSYFAFLVRVIYRIA